MNDENNYTPISWDLVCLFDKALKEMKDYSAWRKFCSKHITKFRFDLMANSSEAPGL